MASFNLFDKPQFTGRRISTPASSERPKHASPVSGVKWQVLTVNGMRMSCTSIAAMTKSGNATVPLKAVSHNGENWRSYDQFQQHLARGIRPEIAFEQASWLQESEK